ncbi:MAG: type VI secretion system tube protein Hcp [Alphaproteobacteria bacterium]|nr:type VI secretion system tube protein Hcp [Alphaproteobacteria bacterium]MCW5742444.1 type VI secretion system tube protein Hcp [Alphaproteobacteria bacterium]
MAIYMEYDGGGVAGDSTAESHTNWITLQSCQWGIGRGISTPVGSAENREASTCNVSEIVVTKMLDSASGPLWQELVKNTDGKDVTIDFTSTSGGADNTFMYIKLTNTLVSGMSFSSGGDRPHESLSLNFTKIETKYLEQAFTGTDATGGSVITYDLALSKAT